MSRTSRVVNCVRRHGWFEAELNFFARAHNVVYALDEDGQARARQFAGEKVKVTGKVDAKTKTVHT